MNKAVTERSEKSFVVILALIFICKQGTKS
jgi:hypothetical protein